MDQIVERRRHVVVILRVVAVLHDDEWRGRAGDILRGNVDGHRTFVRHDFAGLIARDAFVDLAVLRLHREPMNRAARRIGIWDRSSEFDHGGRSVTSLSSSMFGRGAAGPPPRRPVGPCCAAIGHRQHAEQQKERVFFHVSHLTVMTVCAAAGCRVAVLAIERFDAKQISPGRHVLQWNAASVAECLPLRHAAIAVDEQVARYERVASGFVNERARTRRCASVVSGRSCRKSPSSTRSFRIGRTRGGSSAGAPSSFSATGSRCGVNTAVAAVSIADTSSPLIISGSLVKSGTVHIVKDRAGFSTRGVARADAQLIAAGRKRRPRIEPDAERLDALIRLGTNREIQRRTRAALRACVIVQARRTTLRAYRRADRSAAARTRAARRRARP